MITSATASEGKTTTAVNLAIAHGQAGQRVLLIEADLRRPKASRALGLDESVGLTTVLIGKVSLTDAIQEHKNGSLHVLSSGAIPPNPAELLQSRAMNDVMSDLRTCYDIILMDAPLPQPVPMQLFLPQRQTVPSSSCVTLAPAGNRSQPRSAGSFRLTRRRSGWSST